VRKEFDHISDARQFIVDRLSDDALLGRGGRLLREGKYLLPYDPAQEDDAGDLMEAIARVDMSARNVCVRIIDLYQIVLDHLDASGYWDAICEVEGQISRDEMLDMLQDAASAEHVIAPRVNGEIESHPEADLFFVRGAGEIYPYVRTNKVIGLLDTRKPVVLWFPGSYDRALDGSPTLNILNLTNGNTGGHYRATNVFDL
jgi:hypothetical protein